MFKLRFRLPSPALVVAMVTLSLVPGGTAVATTTATHKDARADSVLVKKLAPSLSVTHAKSADNATNATNATNANNANNATTAQTANVAKAIGAVTYVKGTVRDAPANGGSGFAESTESDAFCPAGTAVIGTASHANDQGVEASEVLVATATQVAGFCDNFNNIDEPNNFVIAICAAAASVNDPSGF